MQVDQWPVFASSSEAHISDLGFSLALSVFCVYALCVEGADMG